MIDDYVFRVAERRDEGRLIEFLGAHWKKGHVLGRSPELLRWQHEDPKRSRLNFVLADHRGSEDLAGILGFIPTSQFDPALEDERDFWLVTWGTRPDRSAAGLGAALFYFWESAFRPRSVAGLGVNPRVSPLYRALGFSVGNLEHYFFINPEKRHFSLLGGVRSEDVALAACDPEPSIEVRFPDTLGEEASELLLASSTIRPRKSTAYYLKRYVEHPFYRYHLAEVRQASGLQALIVFRIAEHEGTRAVRIVDAALIGCACESIGEACRQLVREMDAEYADLYCHGLDRDALLRGGMRLRRPDAGPIVPGHFEPFERANHELGFAHRGPDSYRFFKGDSDQDRPNRL